MKKLLGIFHKRRRLIYQGFRYLTSEASKIVQNFLTNRNKKPADMGEGVSKPRKKSCSVLWTVPDNILTYFFFCEIAAPPTVQWRESSLDAQYRKPRKRDRGDSMHHQITSSSHHPHPESPFKSKSGKNTDLFLKIVFSKKATKIDQIFTVNLTLCSKCQNDGEDLLNFCDFFRKCKL